MSFNYPHEEGAFGSGALGGTSFGWEMYSDPDVIGGDGSDDDLQLIAEMAGKDARQYLRQTCSNAGMIALADLMDDALQGLIEALPDPDAPDPSPEPLYEAIAGVHSYPTAHSCMTEGIMYATEILSRGRAVIKLHESMEGSANIF